MKYILPLFILSLVLISCNSSKTQSKGASIYKTHCVLCHGEDGKLGLNNSKDLTASTLNLEEKVKIITHGKNTMLAYKSILTKEEIDAVASYVHKLKK